MIRHNDPVGRQGWQPGGLTFVFTDIEGSTELVRDLHSTYGLALRIHRQVVRACVEAEGGSEFGTEGDALFFVFNTPAQAVAAAVAAQHKVENYAWPDGIALRVRMGIHRGPVSISGGEYVGLTVHEVARICGAAHGGQILCSSSVLDGLDPRPDGVEFRALGAYALRGLPAPTSLHQVGLSGAGGEFPPPREALRDGGVRVSIWRREPPMLPLLPLTAPPPPFDWHPVDGSPLDGEVGVEVRLAADGPPGAFRIVVTKGGVVEEEFDGLTVGGSTDAASIVNAYSHVIRIRT